MHSAITILGASSDDFASPIITVVLGGLFLAVLLKMPRARQIGHILDDISGEAARPGVPARPGLMERIQSVEALTAEAHVAATEARQHAEQARSAAEANALENGAISSQLVIVVNAVAQLQSNSGSTMFDAIRRVEADTAAAAGRAIPPQATINDHHAHVVP